jgi:hypothetical protein
MKSLAIVILNAFQERKQPTNIIRIEQRIFADTVDASYFSNKICANISWDDWSNHSDAIFTLSPEAFIYFLPSVLILSLENPLRWLGAADVVINSLNRSANYEYWDNWFLERFTNLTFQELDTITSWVEEMSLVDTYTDQDGWMRVYQTLDLLKNKIKRY